MRFVCEICLQDLGGVELVTLKSWSAYRLESVSVWTNRALKCFLSGNSYCNQICTLFLSPCGIRWNVTRCFRGMETLNESRAQEHHSYFVFVSSFNNNIILKNNLEATFPPIRWFCHACRAHISLVLLSTRSLPNNGCMYLTWQALKILEKAWKETS